MLFSLKLLLVLFFSHFRYPTDIFGRSVIATTITTTTRVTSNSSSSCCPFKKETHQARREKRRKSTTDHPLFSTGQNKTRALLLQSSRISHVTVYRSPSQLPPPLPRSKSKRRTICKGATPRQTQASGIPTV